MRFNVLVALVAGLFIASCGSGVSAKTHAVDDNINANTDVRRLRQNGGDQEERAGDTPVAAIVENVLKRSSSFPIINEAEGKNVAAAVNALEKTPSTKDAINIPRPNDKTSTSTEILKDQPKITTEKVQPETLNGNPATHPTTNADGAGPGGETNPLRFEGGNGETATVVTPPVKSGPITGETEKTPVARNFQDEENPFLWPEYEHTPAARTVPDGEAPIAGAGHEHQRAVHDMTPEEIEAHMNQFFEANKKFFKKHKISKEDILNPNYKSIISALELQKKLSPAGKSGFRQFMEWSFLALGVAAVLVILIHWFVGSASPAPAPPSVGTTTAGGA